MNVLVYFSDSAIESDATKQIETFLSYNPDTVLYEIASRKTADEVDSIYRQIESAGISKVYFLDEKETLDETSQYLNATYPEILTECIPESFGRLQEADTAQPQQAQQAQANQQTQQAQAQAKAQPQQAQNTIVGFIIPYNLPVKGSAADLKKILSTTALKDTTGTKQLNVRNAFSQHNLIFMAPRLGANMFNQFLDSSRLLTLLTDMVGGDLQSIFTSNWTQISPSFNENNFNPNIHYDIIVPKPYQNAFAELQNHTNISLYIVDTNYPISDWNSKANVLTNQIIEDFKAQKIEVDQSKKEYSPEDLAIISLIQMRIDFLEGKFKPEDRIDNIINTYKAYKEAFKEFFKDDIAFFNSVLDLYGLGLVKDVYTLGKNLAKATAKMGKDEIDTEAKEADSYKAQAEKDKADKANKDSKDKNDKAEKARAEAKQKLVCVVRQHSSYAALKSLFF